ncbi:MAG: tetratricopeptide repeat protein [Pirellulaceae bacterium]
MANFGYAQETEQQEQKQQDSTAHEDLDKAFELKIMASNTKDLEDIVELCESAIEKGLKDENLVQANDLLTSSLLEYAQQYEALIFAPSPDVRWRVYRRKALESLKKLTEIKQDNIDAYMLMARLQALDGGDPFEAAKAADRAIELAEDDETLAKALIVRASVSDDNESRMNDINQAVKIDPENVEAVRMRAMLLLQSEETELAIADLKRWIELSSDDVTPSLLLIQILTNEERKDEAAAILDEAIERSPENATLLSIRARNRMQDGENEEALKDAEKALAIDKDDVEALVVRAIVRSDQDDHDGALDDINRVLRLQPGSVRGYWIRGIIYASNRDYKHAIEDVGQLANTFPEEKTYTLQLAGLYNADDQPDKAVKIYERLLEDNPNDWEIIRGRGDAFLSMGKHDTAVEDYTKALEFMPDDEPDDGVYNNLAWVLSTSTFAEVRDGKKAIEYALKAAELTEYDAPHILSTLASSYAEAGDFDKAREWAEKAVKLGEEKDEEEDLLYNLRRELEAYKENRAWRELQEPGKKDSGFPAPIDGEKAESPESSENGSEKTGDPKADSTDNDGGDDSNSQESESDSEHSDGSLS